MDPNIAAKHKIVILGGYGNFGKRISHLLLKEHCILYIAGRNLDKAQRMVQELSQYQPHALLEPVALNWRADNFQQLLKHVQPTLLIHCAGPFQEQDYTVARTCIELGIHYVDLADGRHFVTHIDQFDKQAKIKGCVIISGASSVPGLSSVVVDNFVQEFKHLRSIMCGIASGNKTERGNATIEGILGYVGKPFQRLENKQWQTVYGWQDLHRFNYGKELGWRWHANCDIPDLALFPQRYPKVETVTFYAGLEVALLHFTMWLMSWLVRSHLIANWAPLAKGIIALSSAFKYFGTDQGGMVVQMQGTNNQDKPQTITWLLTAKNGNGPYVPTIPCVILAKKILRGEISAGARPCLGLFNLKEFEEIAKFWHITHDAKEQ